MRQAGNGANAGDFEPMSAGRDRQDCAGKTGGPIVGHAQINAQGAGPSFGTHHGRRRGRRGDRACHGHALHRAPGRRQGGPPSAMSRASIRAALSRASAGRSTRNISTARTASCRTPGSSTTASRRLGRADDRRGDCRGAQPAPSLWRAGGRRNTDRAAHGGHHLNAVENAIGIRFTELPMSPPQGPKGRWTKANGKPAGRLEIWSRSC